MVCSFQCLAKAMKLPEEVSLVILLILIEEQEDRFLKRDGNNLVYDLYISFIDAAIGTSVEVPAVNGKVKIKIEPGTQSGKILRLRGKGIKTSMDTRLATSLFTSMFGPLKSLRQKKKPSWKVSRFSKFRTSSRCQRKGLFRANERVFQLENSINYLSQAPFNSD